MNTVLNTAPPAPKMDPEVEDEEDNWQKEVAPVAAAVSADDDVHPDLQKFQEMLGDF